MGHCVQTADTTRDPSWMAAKLWLWLGPIGQTVKCASGKECTHTHTLTRACWLWTDCCAQERYIWEAPRCVACVVELMPRRIYTQKPVWYTISLHQTLCGNWHTENSIKTIIIIETSRGNRERCREIPSASCAAALRCVRGQVSRAKVSDGDSHLVLSYLVFSSQQSTQQLGI